MFFVDVEFKFKGVKYKLIIKFYINGSKKFERKLIDICFKRK